MAEFLGLPHATIIMQVEVLDGSIRVKRELEEGWFQNIEMPLPALLTIQSGISKLRYATLMGIKHAKTKEIRRVTPEELGVAPSPRARDYARLSAAEDEADGDTRRRCEAGRAKTGGTSEIRGTRSVR